MKKERSEAITIIGVYLFIISLVNLVKTLPIILMYQKDAEFFITIYLYMKSAFSLAMLLGAVLIFKLKRWAYQLSIVTCILILILDEVLLLTVFKSSFPDIAYWKLIALLKPAVLFGLPVYFLYRPKVREQFR